MSHIYLCGLMGSGKSTVGKHLAKQLELPFIDTDRWIQGFEQMTISDIFSKKGEDYFRDLEQQCINELLINTDSVIGLGGGSLTKPVTQHLVKDTGKLIYLKASTTYIYERIKDKSHRPLLMKDGQLKSEAEIKKTLDQLLQNRKEQYEHADVIIETDAKSINEIVEEILEKL